jgi:hypothetical protein
MFCIAPLADAGKIDSTPIFMNTSSSMRHLLPVIAALLLFLPAAGDAQPQNRHGSNPNHEPANAPPAEDSDTATFTRAIAGQATEEQAAYFLAMTRSTETARQQAGGIERQGANANNSEELISRAATLQLSLDQALSDTSKFRRSFTNAQEATLKAPAKKLAKSDAGVSKSAKNLSHQLEQIPPEPGRVLAAVANVEKALEDLQSDQRNLAKAMGISSR